VFLDIAVQRKQVIRPPAVVRCFSVLSTSRVYAPVEDRALKWRPPQRQAAVRQYTPLGTKQCRWMFRLAAWSPLT